MPQGQGDFAGVDNLAAGCWSPVGLPRPPPLWLLSSSLLRRRGAFNISIFGLHGRRPGRCPVAPIPPPSPTRSLQSAIRDAGLVQYLAGCHKQKGGVPPSHRQRACVQVRCGAKLHSTCILPSYILNRGESTTSRTQNTSKHLQVPTTVTRLPAFGSSTSNPPSSWKHLPVTSSEILYEKTKRG